MGKQRTPCWRWTQFQLHHHHNVYNHIVTHICTYTHAWPHHPTPFGITKKLIESVLTAAVVLQGVYKLQERVYIGVCVANPTCSTEADSDFGSDALLPPFWTLSLSLSYCSPNHALQSSILISWHLHDFQSSLLIRMGCVLFEPVDRQMNPLTDAQHYHHTQDWCSFYQQQTRQPAEAILWVGISLNHGGWVICVHQVHTKFTGECYQVC